MKIITISAKKSLFVIMAYLLMYTTAYTTEPRLSPIATVTLNDPPPPWEVRPNLQAAVRNAEQPQRLDNLAIVSQQSTASTIAQPKADQRVLTLEDNSESKTGMIDLPATHTQSRKETGVAAWYRNRQYSQSHDSDFDQIEKNALDGNIKAQYQLGLLYYSGSIERPQNTDTAIHWLGRAAEQGNSDAQYSLGLLYSNDNSHTVNTTLAQKWLRASAEQGHIAAKIALLDHADHISQTEQKTILAASSSAKVALRPEQPQEEIRVANITAPPRIESSRINRPSSARSKHQKLNVSHLKQDAYSGDRRSQLLLGSLYEDGKQGISKNLAQAAKWYRKAAKQGYPQAQYNLGLLYEEGKGMTKNYHKATQWYKRAADKGLSEAQNNLGVLYIMGKGVAKNKKRAETLFRHAAKQGNRNAVRNLNLLLEKH